MSDQGPWVTKTILELEERVAELTEEIGHLEDSLIKRGQMLREIVNITKGPPEENSWHSTHDAVESVERLQARVAELESFINQAPVETGVCMCGEEMYRHSSQPNHTLMDSWDYERDLILRNDAEKG